MVSIATFSLKKALHPEELISNTGPSIDLKLSFSVLKLTLASTMYLTKPLLSGIFKYLWVIPRLNQII